jgi:hypothetical protein
LVERLAIYTIKGWKYSDEKNNVMGCLRLRYTQAKENGLKIQRFLEDILSYFL